MDTLGRRGRRPCGILAAMALMATVTATAAPQTATSGSTAPDVAPAATRHAGLWRAVAILHDSRPLDAEGLVVVRDDRISLFAAAADSNGPTLALAGDLHVDGERLQLESATGGLRRAGTARLEPWQPAAVSLARRDDTLALSLGEYTVRTVRLGLGVGQTARLDAGALTLADDRFVLVALGSEGLRAGVGTFYRRAAVYTLTSHGWLAQTAQGLRTTSPAAFEVDASATLVQLPDGGEVRVVEPLNRRPPRVPRDRRPARPRADAPRRK